MSKLIYYKQVFITKDNRADMAWIPEKFAVKDRMIDVKINDEWDRGWRVVWASQMALIQEQLNIMKDQARNTREASDI